MARVEAYRLARPTLEALQTRMRKAVGTVRSDQVLERLRERCGITDMEPTVSDLQRLASALIEEPGVLSVLGTSVEIRCETYLTLGGEG